MNLKFREDSEEYKLWSEIVNDIYLEYDTTDNASEADSLTEKIEKLLDLVSRPVEPEVSDANGGHWQKCPKCDGQGIISKPPWINGDQNTWTASEGSYTCNLCNGQMVIKQ
jgi:hypothetical protein